MRSKASVVLLLVVGFISGIFFVMSCSSGGGGGIIGGSIAGAQTTIDMTGVESRLDQLITINTQLLSTNSEILSKLGGTVNPSNHGPIAVASAQSTCVVSGSGIAGLIGAASSDPDGDVLTYKWQFVDMPYGSTAKLNDPSIRNPWFTVDVPGNYIVRLTVSDGPRAGTQTVTITGAVSCL